MKKVALSLLALALVGSMAFGQDAAAPTVKLGGYLDMGTLTTVKSDSGTQTIVKGDDSGKVGGSYEFRLNYTAAKSGFVLNVRLEDLTAAPGVTSGAYTGTVYNAQDAFAWFLIPGVDAIKVLAGSFSNTGVDWNMPDDKGDKQTAGTGVATVITPVAGFSLGGGYVPSQAVSGLGVWSAGATFAVPSTVQLYAALKTAANTSNANAVDNAAVGFKVLVAGPFSAKGAYNLYNAAYDKKAYNTSMVDVTLGYAITDAFSAGLLTYVWIYGSDVKTGTLTVPGDSANASYKINPSITYVVDPITTVQLAGSYIQGSNAAYNPTAATPAYVSNKTTTIEINPNATFTIDANQKVYVNYLFDSLSGDDVKIDKTQQTFKVDYRYIY